MTTQQDESITIVSKSGLFRNGLKSLLNDSPFSIIDQVQTIDQIDDTAGGIILVDAGANPSHLIEEIRAFNNAQPDRPVVILADILEWTCLVTTLEAGASGYLLKDISTEALVGSLKLVALGEKIFPTDMTALLLRGAHPGNGYLAGTGPHPNLSQRENEILRFLVEGESNKMIARRLDVTEATVKVHMKSLLRKLKCSNRTQAAIWALNHGFNGEDTEADDEKAPRESGNRNGFSGGNDHASKSDNSSELRQTFGSESFNAQNI